MAGDKDKKKKRSSKKGSKDRAKSRAKPLDAEAFDRAATTLNDATAKLMRAAERHALGDVNHDGAPPDDRVRWYEEGRRAGRDEAILHDAPPDAGSLLAAQLRPRHGADDELRRARRRAGARARRSRSPAPPPAYDRRAAAPRDARRAAAAGGRSAPRRPLHALLGDVRRAAHRRGRRRRRRAATRSSSSRRPTGPPRRAPAAPRGELLRGAPPAAAARWVRDRARPSTARSTGWTPRRGATPTRCSGGCATHQARSAELGRAAEQLAQDVADVDRLALEASNAEADAAAEKAPASKVGFVHRFAELCHEVEEVAGLELPRLPDADPDAALPRELQERLAALANAEGWREALDVKDEMLWELADRLAAADAALAKEKALTEDYAGEVAHWVDLAKDLRGQLDAARARADAGDERRRLRALEREAELRADELAARAPRPGPARGAPAPARRRRGRGRRRRRLGPPPPARSNPATLSPAAGACLERRDERVAQPLGRLAPAGQTRRGHRLSIIILAVETRRGGFLDAPRDVTTCTFFFRRRLRFLC